MSEQRDVCLWLEDYGDDEVISLCGMIWFSDDSAAARAWPLAAWVNLPRDVQCGACALAVATPLRWETVGRSAKRQEIQAEVSKLSRSHATTLHILSVSLFCGALAGALDPTLADLIADSAGHAVALDLAEERGMHEPGYRWPEGERRGWREVDEHGTGNNPHVWLPVPNGVHVWHDFADGAVTLMEAPLEQCPCGRYAHGGRGARQEVRQSSGRIVVGEIDAVDDWSPDSCHDPRCDMPRGHSGDHYRRWYAGHGNISEESWPDGADPDAAEDPSTISAAHGY